jgi:RHS repeat-associated protein
MHCPCSAVELSRNSRLGEKLGRGHFAGVRSLLSAEPHWKNCEASGEASYGQSLYNSARYHDPSSGRFISPDPIGFEGGINYYAFVDNNPSDLIDPTALKPRKCDQLSL